MKKYALKEQLMSVGPGMLIVGSFIGPGTVTSATRAGANYGYSLFWCVIFSVIAVIVLQGMASRLGIITQEGLAENLVNDFKQHPALQKTLCWLVAISIAIGCFAYMAGDLTGTSIGISAPDYRFPLEKALSYKEEVLHSAAAITEKLGWKYPIPFSRSSES